MDNFTLIVLLALGCALYYTYIIFNNTCSPKAKRTFIYTAIGMWIVTILGILHIFEAI